MLMLLLLVVAEVAHEACRVLTMEEAVLAVL
jgi:hypothetical protein